jgi:hypothetical protein
MLHRYLRARRENRDVEMFQCLSSSYVYVDIWILVLWMDSSKLESKSVQREINS